MNWLVRLLNQLRKVKKLSKRNFKLSKIRFTTGVVIFTSLALIAFVYLSWPGNAEEEVAKTWIPKVKSDRVLKVATWNIWNKMFHFPIRKLRIAEVIQREHIDIIGLQEVRMIDGQSQAEIIQELLPDHKYIAYVPAIHGPANQPSKPLEEAEGVALLSKFPIIEVNHINLTILPGDPDTNPRVVLRALIDVPNLGALNVFVFHISYEKNTQCRNINEALPFLSRYPTKTPQVLLGDFNCYADFEGPVMQLTDGSNSFCPLASYPRSLHKYYRDSWIAYQNKEGDQADGRTFSLMPWPGLQSRPDRILVNNECLTEREVMTIEDGKEYKEKYYWSIIRKRTSENYEINNPLHWGLTLYVLIWMIFIWQTTRWGVLVPVVIVFLCHLCYIAFYVGFMEEEFFPSDHKLVIATYDLCKNKT